jgi:serine/threonine protein kinase
MDSSSDPSFSKISHTNTLSSVSFLSGSGRSVQHDALGDLRSMLNVLYVNSIPGPNLIRIKKEFNLCTGEGGEGTVYEASLDFASNLASIAAEADVTTKARIGHSAKAWRSCVIKQLRSDGDRHLAFQVNSALTEIKILSQNSFIQNPNIVTLLGWALCLDSLENLTSSIPRLPLLVLEKAHFDLKSFLNSVEYEHTLHSDLCAICLGIGKGLQALHSKNISHGDMKPTNVLIFDNYAGPEKKLSKNSRWTPKLCDFGLATTFQETAHLPNKLRYKGTEGWRPPESYAESPPKSFQLCDIFAYGLVVWCIFVGVPSSPISIQVNQDEESAAIRENIGEQTYYRNASQSIRTVYDLLQGDIHLTLVELVDGAISTISRPINSKWSFRTRRKAFLETPREIREEQINRALIVLRESLNDDPARRDSRPWDFMDAKRYQSIGPVQDPEKCVTQLKANHQSQVLHNLFKSCITVVSQMSDSKDRTLSRVKHMYTRKRRHIIHSLIVFISTWMPVLIPQNPQQQIYERIYSQVESNFRDKEARQNDSRLYSFGPSDIDPFEHEDGDKCHNLVYFYTLINRALDFQNEESHRSFACLDASVLYTFARIRSRIKICCWHQYSQKPVIWDKGLDSSDPPGALAMRQEVSLLMFVLCRKNFETLAWFCRGEIAKNVSQGWLQENPYLLWSWIRVHYSDPHHSTHIMTLLLENGWNIGQQLLFDGSERSVIMIIAFNHSYIVNPRQGHVLQFHSLCTENRSTAATPPFTSINHVKGYVTDDLTDPHSSGTWSPCHSSLATLHLGSATNSGVLRQTRMPRIWQNST